MALLLYPLYASSSVSVCKAFPHDPPLPYSNTAFQSCHSNVRVKKCKQCCWVSSAYKVNSFKVNKNSVDKLCSSIVKSSNFLSKKSVFYILLVCQPISFLQSHLLCLCLCFDLITHPFKLSDALINYLSNNSGFI